MIMKKMDRVETLDNLAVTRSIDPSRATSDEPMIDLAPRTGPPCESTTWERIQALPVQPWAGGAKEHWMRLTPSRITGRRLVVSPSG